MTVYILLALTWALFAIGNGFVGSDHWKDMVAQKTGIAELGGRWLAFASCTLLCFVIAILLNYGFWEAVTAAGLVALTFVGGRQRSPRGAFFLLSDGGAGWPNSETGGFDYADGKHNRVSNWLAELISGIDFFSKEALYGRNNKNIVKYGHAYGLVHITWWLVIAAIPISYFVTTWVWLLVPLGASYGIIHNVAGNLRPLHASFNSRRLAEIMTGGLIYAPFCLGFLLLGA